MAQRPKEHVEDPNRRGPDYGKPTFVQKLRALLAGQSSPSVK